MQLLELDDFVICAIIDAIDDEDIFHFANTCRTLKKLSVRSIFQRRLARRWKYIDLDGYRLASQGWIHPIHVLHAANTKKSPLHLVHQIDYNASLFKENPPPWLASDESARPYKIALEQADELEHLLLGLPFLNKTEKADWIRDLKAGCSDTALVVLIALCSNTTELCLFLDYEVPEQRSIFTKLSQYINFQRLSYSLPNPTNIQKSHHCTISRVYLAGCMVADVIEVLKLPSLRDLSCHDVDEDAESSWKTTWEAEVRNNTLVETVCIESLGVTPATIIEFCHGMPALKWLRFAYSLGDDNYPDFLEDLVCDTVEEEQRLEASNGRSLESIGMSIGIVRDQHQYFIEISSGSTGAGA